MRRWVLAMSLAACGRHEPGTPGHEPAPATATAAGASGWRCEPLAFAESTPVPEASGAAWLTIDGKSALFVISDSGNYGAFGILDPDTGETRSQGALPPGDHGDDYEGVAARHGAVIAVLSSGYTVQITRGADATFTATSPEPLGPEIAKADEVGGHGTRPPNGSGMVCGAKNGNCGRNFEGICIDDRPGASAAPGACIGFAASKADGHLYCLTDRDGRLAADFTRRIAVTKPGALADCAFASDGSLWVGSNVLELSAVSRVIGWEDPAHARVEPVGPVGIGNSEVLAVAVEPNGYVVYRMSDTNTAPSLMAKFRCAPPTK